MPRYIRKTGWTSLLTVTDNRGATATDTVVVTVFGASLPPSGPSSKDRIIGERESGGEALGYYVNSNDSTVGTGNSSGTRTDRNVAMGYMLPTLPAGARATSATLRFEITGGRDSH